MSARKILASVLVTLSAASYASARSAIYRRQGCTAALLVDDFSQWEEGLNLLEGAAGYDKTMEAIGLDDEGILNFEPVDVNSSYIFEELPCVDAAARGLDSLAFRLRGPEAASVSVELQTRSDCAGEQYQRAYLPVDGLSGDLDVITVALDGFGGRQPAAAAAAVVRLVWFGFSAGAEEADREWAIDDVRLTCAGAEEPTEGPPAPTGEPPAPTEDSS